MKIITSIVFLLVAFTAGYLFNSVISPNYNERVITIDSSRNVETGQNESDVSVENKLDLILTELNRIALNIDNKQSYNNEIVNSTNELVDKSENKSTYMTSDDIADSKNQIYNSLLETNYTIKQLVSSDELNNLSAVDKQEVLDEIARRIDSGEINKEEFLPGYKFSSN